MCLAVPGRIERVWVEDGTAMATVDFAGEPRRVCLAYLPELVVGDYVMAHAGFALTRIDAVQARATLAMMREYGLLDPVADEAVDPAPEPAPEPAAERAAEPVECTDEVCITCRDEAEQVRVLRPPGPLETAARVRAPGGTSDVDVSLVAPVRAGDLLLVHAGVALTRLDPDAGGAESYGEVPS